MTVNVEQVSNEVVSLAVTFNFKYCIIQTWVFLNYVDEGILTFLCLKSYYFDHFCADWLLKQKVGITYVLKPATGDLASCYPFHFSVLKQFRPIVNLWSDSELTFMLVLAKPRIL